MEISMPETAFTGSPRTSNSSFDSSSDHKTPSLGALSMGSMTSLTALSGTTGIDCSLIHGDEWNQMEGNLTENILKNHTAVITLNETYTVKSNVVKRVNGTTNDTRVGVHNQTNISPRNDVFMHTRSETHHQPECREHKTEDNEKGNDLFQYDSKVLAWHLLMIDTFGMRFEFNTTMNFEKKLLYVGANIFCIEDRAFEVKMEEIKTSLGGLATEIKGGKIKAAATHIKAIAGNINAGIALNADSPFG
jgi:hypothetical protein